MLENNSSYNINNLQEQLKNYVLSGDYTIALEMIERLDQEESNNIIILQWQIIITMALNKLQDAIRVGYKALNIIQKDELNNKINIYFNMAQCYGLLGDFQQAIEFFDKILCIQPNHTNAIFGSAKIYSQLALHNKAGQLLSKFLTFEPNNLEAIILLANSLLKVGAFKEALKYFNIHEKLKPASPFVACMIIFLNRQLANWEEQQLPMNLQEREIFKKTKIAGKTPELAILSHRALQNMPSLEPFVSLVLYDDPALHYHVTKQFLKQLHPEKKQKNLEKINFKKDRRLRIAYVSSEFNEHATSYLLSGVLDKHDKEKVEVYLLNFAPSKLNDIDEMQIRIKNMGHIWVDIHKWNNEQVALWCQNQNIDIAIDLKGLTKDHRIDIFSYRIAPIQINWLGYPGTLPSPYFDWILADNIVLPLKAEKYFSEKIYRLPFSYQPNDCNRIIDKEIQKKLDHDLPKNSLVLACFNNTFKITPEIWAIWIRLLKVNHTAVLWLLDTAIDTKKNLQEYAKNAGIEIDRIIFAPILTHKKHLARLKLADLSLDTFPYNAHTTASDALWAGIPHIACTGESFASRVGASLLTALEVPELIAYGLIEYERIAMDLINNEEKLISLRKKISQKRETAPLFDTQSFVNNLENALYEIALNS